MAVPLAFTHFRVIILLMAISSTYLVRGQSYSNIVVTPTPFGGGQSARLAYLFYESSSYSLGRAVRLGLDPPGTDLSNPAVYNITTQSWDLPLDLTAIGAYSSSVLQSATVIILAADRTLTPSSGKVTVRANVGETVTLAVENLAALNVSDIEWEKFSNFASVQSGGLSYTIPDITTSDADYYGAFETGKRAELKYSLIKLIVRECPAGYFGPPLCNNVCPNCYNGGVCSDQTGECMCAPGFDGEHCLTACGESKYGWDCRYTCGEPGNPLSQSSGSHVCLPDPYGCSCLAGFTGAECTLTCPLGTFGAGCDQTCHCMTSALCDRFTGACSDNQCAAGWSGENCQIPDVCPEGYFGVNCTETCNCLGNKACHKETADCDSTGGLCAPGYASNEVQLADCQYYEGCFDNCTKTCHCRGGESVCDSSSGTCSGGRGCLSEWTGTSCQTGIVHSEYVKVNSGQPMPFTCVFKSDVDPSSLTVLARLGTATGQSVNPVAMETTGPLYNVSFSIPLSPTFVYCVVELSVTDMASSGAQVTYYALPTLTSTPSVLSYTKEYVTIEWPAWKASNSSNDRGEGPIIGYSVFYTSLNGSVAMAAYIPEDVDDSPALSFEFNVTDLSPGETYTFSVSASREGEGGEGPRGPESASIVLPADPTTVPMMSTVTRETTTPKEGGTMRPGNPGTQSPVAANNLVLYIAIPVAVFACILIIIIIMVIIGVRRRKRRKLFHDRREQIVMETQAMNDYPPEFQDNLNEGYEEKTHLTQSTDEADGHLDTPTKKRKAPIHPVSPPPVPPMAPRPPSHTTRPILVADFASHVQKNRMSHVFEEEWSLLPPDITKPCEVANLPANKVKNRYRNILAYDHCRVILDQLDGKPDSDYINACYIDSIDKEKAYIATQGPNKASLHDFWRMVWAENVHNIVMVTNLVEDGKNKCIQYWPGEGKTEKYGQLMVTCHSEDMEYNYVIRVYNVTDVHGSESRTLKQFHFKGWPDKGVPRFAAPVLRMMRDVNESQQSVGDVPLLVHCSAGAGRTGVIIAVDSILKAARNSQEVDIFSFVHSMRENRPHMVQTAEQYAFVHEAVLEALLCGDTFIPASEITDRTEQLQWPNPDSNKTAIQEEFEVMGIVSEVKGMENGVGHEAENQAKNRYQEIIPQDRCRPYLMTPGENGDTNNYINASFVSSFSKKNGYITTQMPLANTVLDFWRLVYDYHVTTIVMLNGLEDESCSLYWPVNTRSVTFGPFTISHKGSESMNKVKVRTLDVYYKEEGRQIRQFEVQSWPNGAPDTASLDAVLQLMDYLHQCARQQGQEDTPTDIPPVLIHCLSGLHESGVFCTVMNCLEQLQSVGAIDVFQNLRVLRMSRPNLVPSLKEYSLCYQLLARQHALYSSEKEEEDDYDNPPVQESLYQNVDFRKLKESDTHSMASEC